MAPRSIYSRERAPLSSSAAATACSTAAASASSRRAAHTHVRRWPCRHLPSHQSAHTRRASKRRPLPRSPQLMCPRSPSPRRGGWPPRATAHAARPRACGYGRGECAAWAQERTWPQSGAFRQERPDFPSQQSEAWSSTMPIACIRAYIVVGPTNLNPSFFSSFASAVASEAPVFGSAIVVGRT